MEIKKIEDMSLEEMQKIKFLSKEELKKLEFAELCIYMENLNKLEARYNEINNIK